MGEFDDLLREYIQAVEEAYGPCDCYETDPGGCPLCQLRNKIVYFLEYPE